jgi:LuxR family maltose regulon positive regulatory protein
MSKVIRPILTEIFARKRLFSLLDQVRDHPVIWVSGPAGCGKTTLVNSYLEARKIPCLWYEVDEGDADLATFIYYLGQAAKRAAPRKRSPLPLLTPEYLQGIPTFTKRFFENLYERLQIPSCIVFDNYQEVSVESPFHEAILRGLSNLPPGINAVLISRAGPPASFIRLRANHLMEILAWKDLRLTLEESAGITKLRSKQKLSKETIAELHKAADGWTAGLVLMLERAKVEDTEPQMAGKGRPEEIFDYFASEIFDRTDREVQAFLLKTSILPKMTPRMAEELTGISSASHLLSMLSRNNYFTEKRLHSEPIYQYHPLFREFLLSRAKETLSQENLLALFRRAASLLEEDGQIEVAVTLLQEIGDRERIVRSILKHAPSMAAHGRYRPLQEWLSSLPKGMMEKDPWLLYWMGICCLPFDPAQSRHYFENAFERFKTQKEVTGIILACWGIVHSIIYGMADYKPLDRWIPVLEELGHSFKELPSDEIELYFTSALFSALAYRQPQHPEIETWAERALSLAEGSSNLNLKLQTIATVAIYRVQTGDFGKVSLIINSLRKLSQSRDATPLIRIRLGIIEAAYYRFVGLYEKCLKAITDGLELSRVTGIHTFEIALLYHGVCSAVSASDHKAAAKFLEEMSTSLRSFRPWDLCTYHSAKAQEALVREDPREASLHIEKAMNLKMEAGYTILDGWCHIQNAHVMHELGRHREAAEHLAHAFDFSRKIRGKNTEYGALLAEALFSLDQGKDEAGLNSLRKAFALGRERGYFGTWGPPPSGMAKLCTQALEAGIEIEYVQELIRRLNVIPDQPPLHLENWPWPLKIFTLGRFELIRDGNPIQFSRKVQQKPLAMLKALIAFGGSEVREEQISDVLWPEADGDAAHMSFITTLHRLRQLLGYEKAIQYREGRVKLDERYCWLDLWAFEYFLGQVDAKWKEELPDRAIQLTGKAIKMYRGSFMAGEPDKPWAISMRERLKSKFIRTVNQLAHYWEKTGQWENALECYQKALEVDDIIEELYQNLMTCYQRMGKKAEAIAIYNRCRKTLSAALGIEPSSKTQTIYRSLLSA